MNWDFHPYCSDYDTAAAKILPLKKAWITVTLSAMTHAASSIIKEEKNLRFVKEHDTVASHISLVSVFVAVSRTQLLNALTSFQKESNICAIRTYSGFTESSVDCS